MDVSRETLREEFALWLSSETWNWTTYGTLTFSRPMKRDALRFAKAWVRFIARTAAEVWGFCFQETHWDAQRLHVHCLLSVRRNLLKQPTNEEMWSWWFQRFGRNLILDFRQHSVRSPSADLTNSRACGLLASYLTKYVVKEAHEGGFDWDFFAYSDGKELDTWNFGPYSMKNGGSLWDSSALF